MPQNQLVPFNKVNGKCSNENFSTSLNDVNDRLQQLLKPKWILDDDTYNLDAFDQCEGAWPIAHPLPLPLWFNSPKKPFVIENVSNCFPFRIYFVY